MVINVPRLSLSVMPQDPSQSVQGIDPLPLPDDHQPTGEQPRVTCRLCGRPLYGRQARLWGLGDDCRAKLAERAAPRPGGFDIEQDTLPEV